MSKSEPAGFQPIEVEIGDQNPPAVSEVDFDVDPTPDQKPRAAASKKEA